MTRRADEITKRRMKAKERLLKLTSVSTPLGGLSWTPPKSEREELRKLVAFLEDRRVLFRELRFEVPDEVIRSILGIRERLTEVIANLPEDSRAAEALRKMRSACRRFLDGPHPDVEMIIQYRWGVHGKGDPGWLVALGELRGVFGSQLATLADIYGLDIEDELASILPSSNDVGT
jgi:hypothetical protein